MTTLSTIVSNIKAQIASTLTTYSELTHVNDLTKNKFSSATKRYGVLLLDSYQATGNFKQLTMSHTAEIILTDSYITTALDDKGLQDKVIELQTQMLSLFKGLCETRGNSPSIIVNISDLRIDIPEIIEDQKVVIIRGDIVIMYRDSLS